MELKKIMMWSTIGCVALQRKTNMRLGTDHIMKIGTNNGFDSMLMQC